MTQPEYKSLLEDPSVRRWYNNNKKGSPIVADIYLRRLGNFCKLNDITPVAYAKLSLVKMEDMASDYADHLAEKKNPKNNSSYAPS